MLRPPCPRTPENAPTGPWSRSPGLSQAGSIPGRNRLRHGIPAIATCAPNSRGWVPIEKPGTVAGQKPVRVYARQRDESEDRMSRDGAASLIIVQGPERDPQRPGQHRPSMLTVERDSDVANPACQITLERPPVRIVKRLFHRDATIFKKESVCDSLGYKDSVELINYRHPDYEMPELRRQEFTHATARSRIVRDAKTDSSLIRMQHACILALATHQISPISGRVTFR
jgi:hypothetical protein